MKRSSRKRGFEGLILASLLALLAGCAGHASSHAVSDPPGVKLSLEERQLMATWKAERGLSDGDALSNIMLRRYAESGHAVRYAGDGLYEVLDRKKAKDVVATFFVAGAAK